MRDDDTGFIVIVSFVVIIALCAWFLGKENGLKQWDKPCDQFQQWQYQQEKVPVRCDNE